MMRTVLAMLAFLALATLAPQANASDAIDTTGMSKLEIEQVRTFEAWRKTIPDYEYRLYENVRSLKHRQILTLNLMIGIGIILTALVMMTRASILKRLNQGIPTIGSDDTIPPGRGLPSGLLDRAAVRKVLRQQARILNLLRQMEQYVEHQSQFDQDFTRMAAEVRQSVAKIEQEIGER